MQKNRKFERNWIEINKEITCKSVPEDSMGVRTPVSESKGDNKKVGYFAIKMKLW